MRKQKGRYREKASSRRRRHARRVVGPAGTNVPDGYVQPTLDTPTSPAAYTFDQAVDTCAARTVAGGYSAFSAYVVNDGNHNKVQEWTNPPSKFVFHRCMNEFGHSLD